MDGHKSIRGLQTGEEEEIHWKYICMSVMRDQNHKIEESILNRHTCAATGAIQHYQA